MPNWTASMQQTFEYYIVDPGTWKDTERIDSVRSCSISRDLEAETLGSATIDAVGSLGECYIRAYLITIQNGVKERHSLGTFLVQTPSSSSDGKTKIVSMDAYTPLMELKEKSPALGYSMLRGDNIMSTVYRLTDENVRAPVIKTSHDKTLYDDFVAATDDTWLSFLADLMANAKYEFGLDELGRVLFLPKQEISALQPVWTYTDDNSSILYPDLEMDHDLYGIPNVVEVIYSNSSGHFYAKAINDDPNSPTSTISRGREIMYRITDPELSGDPTEHQIKEYAEQMLRDLSSIEYTVTYTHGYCPVRLGDGVRLNYSRAGLTNVNAKVISQSIKCEPGCPVTEKAIFTKKLWR